MSKSTAHKCTSPTDSAGVGPSNTSVWPGSSCKATKRVWRRVMQTSSTYGTHTYACFKRFLTSSSNTQFWPHLTYLHIRWTTTKLPWDKEMGNKNTQASTLSFLEILQSLSAAALPSMLGHDLIVMTIWYLYRVWTSGGMDATRRWLRAHNNVPYSGGNTLCLINKLTRSWW